jgi:hypothetical protein
MAIIRNFTYARSDGDNFKGLQPAWFANADPTTGRGAAHDMLEHFLGQKGPVEGELAAFGAFVAIRLEQGSMGNQERSEVQILASDIVSVLTDILELELPVPAPKISRPLDETYEWADSTIDAALTLAFADVRKEWAYQGTEDSSFEHLLTPTMRATYQAWMRDGYRRALRRYEGVDLYGLGNKFFKKIQRTLDGLLNSGSLSEGDEIRVSLHPRTFDIGLKVNGNCAYDFGYV